MYMAHETAANRPFISIGPATLNDVSELVSLVNSAYRGETSKQGWTTEADLLDGLRTDEESLAEMMNNPAATFLKAVNQDGKIVGCVFLKSMKDEAYLGMLTVSPTCQNTGLGKQLLRFSEQYAKDKGHSSIVMQVISIRAELINWYGRHGYEKTAKRLPFHGDPRFGIPKLPLEFAVLKKFLL